MLLAEVVATVSVVGATRSRLAKFEALATLLRDLEPDEIAIAIGLLTANPRQGRIGVQLLRNVVVHSSDDENVLVFSKQSRTVVSTGSTGGSTGGVVPTGSTGGSTGGVVSTDSSNGVGDDLVIVVINLDPHAARETMVHLDLPALGLDWHDSLAVHDEVTGQDWHWGQHNYVRLDPYAEPAHVLTVRRTA